MQDSIHHPYKPVGFVGVILSAKRQPRDHPNRRPTRDFSDFSSVQGVLPDDSNFTFIVPLLRQAQHDIETLTPWSARHGHVFNLVDSYHCWLTISQTKDEKAVFDTLHFKLEPSGLYAQRDTHDEQVSFNPSSVVTPFFLWATETVDDFLFRTLCQRAERAS